MLLAIFDLSAQQCEPDLSLPDDELGVFPMPYDKDENPDGGIRDTACVGLEYDFVLTAVVGEIFKLGEAELDLDSLSLKTEGAVDGLPAGMDYACDPPNCSFKQKSRGCIVLYGKPKSGTEGNHKLKISGRIYVNGSPLGLALNFPNTSIAPGDYTVVVGKANDAPCRQLSLTPLVLEKVLEVFPNPAEDFTVVKAKKPVSLEVYSQLGVLVQQFNESQLFEINTQEWAKGVYFLKASSDAHIATSTLLKS